MTAIDDVRAKGFYHVMQADLKAWDEIEAGYTSNYSDRKAGTSSDRGNWVSRPWTTERPLPASSSSPSLSEDVTTARCHVDDRFAELKPQIEALAARLFGASQMAVRKRGRFLPRGALLDAGGEVLLVMATTDDIDAPASPAEVLPRLHDALCAGARDHAAAAVAVCEDVTITPAGAKSTKAVKVLVEHRRGLMVALYLPWTRTMLGAHVFGEVMALAATPAVQVWGEG